MGKAMKWGAIIIGGLVVVVIAALLIVPMFVDVQKFKPDIENWLSETAGRPIHIGKDLRLSLFPWVGFDLSQIRIGNPPGFKEKDFFTVKSADLRFKLLPLLSKDIQVKRFILKEPRIVLVKKKDGQWNFEGPKKKPGKSPILSSETITDEMVMDPNCHVYIPKREAIKAKIAGETIYFCSKECKKKYLKEKNR